MRYEDYQRADHRSGAGLWGLSTAFVGYQREAQRVGAGDLSVAVWHLANGASRAVTRVRDKLVRAYTYRQATVHLNKLSDHGLQDIGITRSQIPAVVRYGRVRQPSPQTCRKPRIGKVVAGEAVNKSDENLAA